MFALSGSWYWKELINKVSLNYWLNHCGEDTQCIGKQTPATLSLFIKSKPTQSKEEGWVGKRKVMMVSKKRPYCHIGKESDEWIGQKIIWIRPWVVGIARPAGFQFHRWTRHRYKGEEYPMMAPVPPVPIKPISNKYKGKYGRPMMASVASTEYLCMLLHQHQLTRGWPS